MTTKRAKPESAPNTWAMAEELAKMAYADLRKHQEHHFPRHWPREPGPVPRDEGPWRTLDSVPKDEYRAFTAAILHHLQGPSPSEDDIFRIYSAAMADASDEQFITGRIKAGLRAVRIALLSGRDASLAEQEQEVNHD